MLHGMFRNRHWPSLFSFTNALSHVYTCGLKKEAIVLEVETFDANTLPSVILAAYMDHHIC